MDIDSSERPTRSPNSAPPETSAPPDDRKKRRPYAPGEQVQLVVDDARTTARVVHIRSEKVYVEGALLDEKYFAGWVPKDALVVGE